MIVNNLIETLVHNRHCDRRALGSGNNGARPQFAFPSRISAGFRDTLVRFTVKKQTDVQLQPLVDGITYDIILGRLKPRERLIEDQLCERFGASRHQVRASFAALEQMGLVERRPNKGAMVRDFSVQEVEEVYEMRALLQEEAASRVPMPAGDSLIKRLEAINAEHGKAVDRGDLEQVCMLNNDFHREIYRACDNQCLADMIERLWIQTLGMRCYAIGDPQLLKRSRKEHAEMIDHLRKGNREAFVRLCVEHIWPSLEAYKRAHGGWSIMRKAV